MTEIPNTFKSLKNMTTFNLTDVCLFCDIIYYKNTVLFFLKQCIISRFNEAFYKYQ